MPRKNRNANRGSGHEVEGADPFIQFFEHEYARIREEQGLEAAKSYFRENFMVQCFACGHMGKTVPPLNCAHCGMYLD